MRLVIMLLALTCAAQNFNLLNGYTANSVSPTIQFRDSSTIRATFTWDSLRMFRTGGVITASSMAPEEFQIRNPSNNIRMSLASFSASTDSAELTLWNSDNSVKCQIAATNNSPINCVGGLSVGGTSVINSSRDGSFRNLSFSGTGPYGAGTGISISGSTISASISTCSGGFLVSASSCYAVAAGPGTASYTSGLGISGLKVDFYVESGCVGSARYVNTVQLSAPSTLVVLCDALSNGISASSPISVSGTGAVTISCSSCLVSSDLTTHVSTYHVGGTATCPSGEYVTSVTVSNAGVPSIGCAP